MGFFGLDWLGLLEWMAIAETHRVVIQGKNVKEILILESHGKLYILAKVKGLLAFFWASCPSSAISKFV